MTRMRWGIVALLGLSAAAIAVADVVNPGVSPVAEPVSRYVNFTAGWLITVAILGIGVASVGVVALARPVLGRALLAVWAAGVLVAGVFPADPPGLWDRPSTSEMVHGTAALIAFSVFPFAAALLARGPGRAMAVLAAGSALATVVFAVYLIDVMDGPSLGFGGVGLAERVLLAVDLAWLALAARRLTRGGTAATATVATSRAGVER